MPRYIDADAFVVDSVKNKRFVFHTEDIINDAIIVEAVYGDLLDAIRNMPTVDAVEVVRCKDCIHSVLLKDAWFKSESPWRYYRNDCRFCSCVELIDSEPLLVDDDFFCKFGERKMDAEVEG